MEIPCLDKLNELDRVSGRYHEIDGELWEDTEDSALLLAGTVIGCIAALAEPTPLGEAGCVVAILATLESIDDSVKLLRRRNEIDSEYDEVRKAYEQCVENHKWYYN